MSAVAPDVDVDADVDDDDGGDIPRPPRAPDGAASTARDDARDDDADDQRLGLLDAATPRGEFVVVALDAPNDDGDGDDDDARRRTYTANEALDHVGFGKFQIHALCFVGFAWAADAMEMMLLSFIGPAMRCEFGVSSDAEGALTSVVFVGMALGAPAWGVVSDARGRKPALLFSSTTTLAAGIGSALGGSFGSVLFFRCLVGVGLGGVPVAYGLFMEFLPRENRGARLSYIEAFWTLGSMLESALAWIVLPRHSWRVLLLISAAPLLGLIACIFIVPESVLYSVNAGRMEEAKETLRRVAATNGKSLPQGELVGPNDRASSSGEFEDRTSYGMGASGASSSTMMQRFVPSGVRALLSKKHAKTSLLVWVIFFGVAFLYYGIVLLTTSLNVRDDESKRGGELACLAHGAPHLSDGEYADIFFSSFGEIPGLIVAIMIVDKIGRRRSMAFTVIATAVFLLPVASSSISKAVRDIMLFGGRSAAFAAFTVLYIFAGEVYPTSIRSTGVGLGNGFARIGGITCPIFAVTLIESGHLTLSVVVFIAVAAVACAAALSLAVETAGRELDADDEPGVELAPVA